MLKVIIITKLANLGPANPVLFVQEVIKGRKTVKIAAVNFPENQSQMKLLINLSPEYQNKQMDQDFCLIKDQVFFQKEKPVRVFYNFFLDN